MAHLASLLLVAFHNLGPSSPRVVGVFARLAKRATLTEQVPALVE
jgi:hypothetical protein